MSLCKKLLILLGVLAVLSPLGLLAEGDAWGEWSGREIAKMLGYVPYGIEKFSELWKAPFADYTIRELSEPLGYIFSAVIGSLLVFGFIYIFARVLARHK